MKLYHLFFCFLLLGCKSDVLPHNFKINKEVSFYNELQKITIYKIKDINKLDINFLKSYPKNDKDYSSEWAYIDIEEEPYLSLKRNVLIFEINTIFTKDQQFLRNLFKKIEKDSNNFYISGIYTPMLMHNTDYIKHYYFHYILDIKEGKLFIFDNRDMW